MFMFNTERSSAATATWGENTGTHGTKTTYKRRASVAVEFLPRLCNAAGYPGGSSTPGFQADLREPCMPITYDMVVAMVGDGPESINHTHG